jgi:hypothetical protein
MGVLVLVGGCDEPSTKPMTDAEYQAKTQQYDSEAHNPVDKITLTDTVLYPDDSGERILTGDVRPIFVAEGRVKSNLLHSNADEVIVKIYMEDKDKNPIDTATITVKDIPPQGVKAFREKVQLLPPRGQKSYMDFDVDSVKTSPVKHP